ncbi:Yip1 domain-containing protein [Gamsiella multidivaricata]|uniref:Yip1 domain-containing protein n=1 Tax=Gamsiella multidivaricata TaxID=101098 RepID=UPI00221E9A21|nr:Yip1 domain-containing protein [Gamsiella multidivaricata]KAI7819810.1 Yip1 domain-containing protein [Gamsiella multidivaricata]
MSNNHNNHNSLVEPDDFLSPAAPSYVEATSYSDTYDNPFETNIPQRINSPSIEPDDVPLPGQKPLSPVKSSLPKVSGNIGSSSTSSISGNIGSSSGLGVGQAMMGNGIDTLDEPVSETLLRDLRNVGAKLQQVLYPKGRKDILKDWDLWGPLLMCLTLSIVLSMRAQPAQKITVFTWIFIIVWLGSAVVTVNAKLLGGRVSFFQSVCVIGYCLFPLVLVSVVSIVVSSIYIRLPLCGVAFAWASWASLGFLSDSNLANRRALGVYPLFLFYFIIAWMILIS